MFELNENKDEVHYGIMFFTLSFPSIPLYFLVILAVYLKNKQKPNMTYKMTNLIHLMQLGQILGHLLTGPMLIFPELQTTLYYPLRVIGPLINILYNGELPTMALLAVSRIFIFSNILATKDIPLFVKVFLSFLSFFLFSVFIYSVSTGLFIFVPPAWTLNMQVPLAGIIANTYLYMSFVSLTTSYASYIIIVYMIHVHKKDSASARSKKNEMAIMTQYTIIVVFITFGLVFWYKASLWFDICSVKFKVALNVEWIIGSYLNPVLILIFNNRESRNERVRNRQFLLFAVDLVISGKDGKHVVPSETSQHAADSLCLTVGFLFPYCVIMLELNENEDEILYGVLFSVLSTPLIPFYLLVIKVVGPAMSMLYNAELPTMALLAVSRILIFCNFIKSNTVPLFVKITLSFVLVYLLFVFFYALSTGFLIFVPPAWKYSMQVPFASFLENAYLIIAFVCLGTAYISYATIAYLIYMRKKDSTSARSRKEEVAIMIQYTIIVFFITIALTFWHKASIWFDIFSPSFRAALNITWILEAYLNPVLILIFNKSVREEFRKLLVIRKEGKASPIVSITGYTK